MTVRITITVKDGCGGYTTSTVARQRASSTHSAEMAARRLSEKLLGSDLGCVQQIIDTDLPAGVTRWEILSASNACQPVPKRSQRPIDAMDRALQQQARKRAQIA